MFTAAGVLDYVDDRNGQRTDFSYTSGKLSQVVASVGTTNQRTVAVGADSGGRLGSLAQTGSGGVTRQVTYSYAPSTNRLISIVDVEGRTTAFEPVKLSV